MTSLLENESLPSLPAQVIISKKSRVKETEIYEDGCYPVQKIIGFYSGKEKAKYYRVQWAPSWIHEDLLVRCDKLIEEFFVEQNIIKDFRGEPTKVKTEKTYEDEHIKSKPLNDDSVPTETVGGHNVFESSLYDSSDCEPLSKKMSKIKIDVDTEKLSKNRVFNSSYYDSSDNEPLIKKKLQIKTPPDHHDCQKNLIVGNDPKVVKLSPKFGKPVTRAMMTTSSPSSKTNSPISKTTSPSFKNISPPTSSEKSLLQCLESFVKIEDVDDSTDGGSSNISTSSNTRRKYNKRQFNKGMQYNLRSTSRHSNFLPDGKNTSEKNNKVHVARKVYNTRQHVKHLTMNRKRGGKGAISRGTKSLPFSYQKMSPPQRRYLMRKAEHICGSTAEVLSKGKNIKEEMPVDNNTVTISQRSLTFSSSQQIMDVKNECFEEEISRAKQNQKTLISLVKQEPDSPDDLCTRFRKTWKTCVSDKSVSVPSDELLNNVTTNTCEIDDKLRSPRDSNHFFSDESDVEVEEKLKCDVCDKLFQTSILLHRHRFIHCAKTAFTFDKRKPDKVNIENKENRDGLGKWQVLSNTSRRGVCDDLFSHHLRPRKENDQE